MRAALLLLSACVDPLAQPAFLAVGGEVGPDVVLEGDDAVLQLVWLTSVGGETCVEIDSLDIVPSLLTYRVEIAGPPTLDGDICVPLSIGEGALGVGALVLVDPDPKATAELTADPSSLLGWFAGTEDGSIATVVQVGNGRIAAVATGMALIVTDGALAVDEEYCRFDAAVSGLTLYDDRGTTCGGWVPLAEAGERTEFQGIDLVAP